MATRQGPDQVVEFKQERKSPESQEIDCPGPERYNQEAAEQPGQQGYYKTEKQHFTGFQLHAQDRLVNRGCIPFACEIGFNFMKAHEQDGSRERACQPPAGVLRIHKYPIQPEATTPESLDFMIFINTGHEIYDRPQLSKVQLKPEYNSEGGELL